MISIRSIGKSFLCILAVLSLAHTATAAQNDKTSVQPVAPAHNTINTDGGTGQYKPAVQVEDQGLPAGHTIFRPKDLSVFGKKN
jgi:hypothetical protein